ncbi:MAG: Cytosol aminopeptidase [Candidatus Heimdallarchaeota archaeon LC_3]|nr:MAG: Cytosol aminopeptidase [Candidatus Heimdallarchaeota archaeon LC_3]
MKIDTKQEITLDEDVDVYIVPVFEEGEINSLFPKPDSYDFKGKSGDLFKLYGQKPKRIIYIGLGKQSDATPDSIRKNFGTIARKIRNKKYTKYVVVFPASLHLEVDKFTEIVVEASILGSYKFEKYLTDPERKREPISQLILLTGTHDSSLISQGLEYGKIVAEATNFTRDLNNTPHMDMNAIIMAQQAKTMAEANGLDVKILGRDEAQKEDMNLFLSVNNGSKDVVPPQFVVLEYNPSDAKKTIVFVGKGITFDTGGISLKPGAGMGDMLYDMCGAGAVIGAMQAIAQIKPRGVKVVGITPLTDNSPSGSATKPGDIIKSKNGKTVQIENTDAEGRLVLADALTYAERYNPDFVIDLATLTGACVIALGGVYAASYFNNVDDNVKNSLLKSGDYTGDLLWHMPLNKEYFEQIKDRHADIKNTGGRPAGSITAAMFLKEFAEKYPWCHLDIAGTAWGDKEKGYRPKGATGFGTRILIEFIRNLNI